MISPDEYNYELPKELIASTPALPRDSARLLVYDARSDAVSFSRFSDLSRFLPVNSLLVMNETKVVPARVKLRKATGGAVEVLFLVNEEMNGGLAPCIAAKKLAIGASLFFPNGKVAVVERQENERFFLRFSFPLEELGGFLEAYGTTPIPKYIKGMTLSETELRARYQTVFAKRPASAAAPTASLHFTDAVFASLGEKRIARASITLHVGLGTFAPVREENISERRLHREWFEVPAETARAIRDAKGEGRPIVAAGTTVMRALESASKDIFEGRENIRGTTELFIFPPFRFAVADALITNFHVPKSSLMMLVDAFLKHKGARRGVLDLYAVAIEEKFRFFSFGDAMLVL